MAALSSTGQAQTCLSAKETAEYNTTFNNSLAAWSSPCLFKSYQRLSNLSKLIVPKQTDLPSALGIGPVTKPGHMVQSLSQPCWDTSYTVELPKQSNLHQSSLTYLRLGSPTA